jgi:hypothetical protein
MESDRTTTMSVLEGLKIPLPNTVQLQEIFQKNVLQIDAHNEIALIFESKLDTEFTFLSYNCQS